MRPRLRLHTRLAARTDGDHLPGWHERYAARDWRGVPAVPAGADAGLLEAGGRAAKVRAGHRGSAGRTGGGLGGRGQGPRAADVVLPFGLVSLCVRPLLSLALPRRAVSCRTKCSTNFVVCRAQPTITFASGGGMDAVPDSWAAAVAVGGGDKGDFAAAGTAATDSDPASMMADPAINLGAPIGSRIPGS
jgi:hypothetical protein